MPHPLQTGQDVSSKILAICPSVDIGEYSRSIIDPKSPSRDKIVFILNPPCKWALDVSGVRDAPTSRTPLGLFPGHVARGIEPDLIGRRAGDNTYLTEPEIKNGTVFHLRFS